MLTVWALKCTILSCVLGLVACLLCVDVLLALVSDRQQILVRVVWFCESPAASFSVRVSGVRKGASNQVGVGGGDATITITITITITTKITASSFYLVTTSGKKTGTDQISLPPEIEPGSQAESSFPQKR